VQHQMNVATLHKDAITGQKMSQKMSVACGCRLLWGPCSAEHAEHA